MAIIPLPQDFRDFLKLFEEEKVDYLLIGGYAVGYYGYPRATADMDVWIAVSAANAEKAARALKQFGMDVPEVTPELFLDKGKVIRVGVPPKRIEIQTEISGAEFDACFARRQRVDMRASESTSSILRTLRPISGPAAATRILTIRSIFPDIGASGPLLELSCIKAGSGPLTHLEIYPV